MMPAEAMVLCPEGRRILETDVATFLWKHSVTYA
jgi:hypothetical protein